MEAYWNAVYSVLVNEANASESERESFVSHFADEPRTHAEWRFRGSLGFGGKLYVDTFRPLRVSCYPEDSTPDTAATIERANAALRAIPTPTPSR